MEQQGRHIPANVASTSAMRFVSGIFGAANNGWRIPYFVASMKFSEAEKYLHVANEMPGSSAIDWDIDELYQRQIDYRRVNDEIVKYLRGIDRPQFFNAITIALLPLDPETGALKDSLDGDEWNPPGIQGVPFVHNLGPVSLGFWDDWDSTDDDGFGIGAIRWNTDEVFGVAIDGQHRLAAIKQLARNQAQGRPEAKSRVPIIFLVFDSRVGFEGPTERATVGLLRDLFIDLNKHAKTVLRARQILLDDMDPHARCVRGLIGVRLEPDLDSLKASPPRIPLALVDWHGELAKFDKGPYITTVLGLDWIVTQILGTPVANGASYSLYGKQITKFRSAIGLDLFEARTRLEEAAEGMIRPFAYHAADLDQIVTGFQQIWNPALVHLLTSLTPYSQLINLRRDQGSLSLDWQSWYKLWTEQPTNAADPASTEYTDLVTQLAEGDPPVSENQLEGQQVDIDSFKLDNLAFNVVFQRALALTLIDLRRIRQEDIEQLSESDPGFSDIDIDIDVDLAPITTAGEFELVRLEREPDAEDEELEDEELEDEELEDEELGTPPHREPGNHMLERAQGIVEAVNHLTAAQHGVLNVAAKVQAGGVGKYLWQESLRKPDGRIDFALGASKRAKEILVAVSLLDLLVQSDAFSDFDGVLESLEPGATDANAILERLATSLDRMAKPDGIGGRILKAAQKDYTEAAARAEVNHRIAAIWNLLVE